MNKNHVKKKCKDTNKHLVIVDHSKCKKIPMTMGFFKANILGGIVGFLAATIAWALTIPLMGFARYEILGTYLTERVYKIGVKLTEIAQSLNIVQTLSYDQALVVKNISYVLYAIGFSIALIIITVLHEFTHKWVWQYGFDKEIKRKEFKIGIKKLTPYCHCKIDISLKKMIQGTIAPTITSVLSVVLIGALIQDPLVVILGLFGVAAGGADQMMVLILLPYLKQAKKKNIICGDLEDTFGCVLYIEN